MQGKINNEFISVLKYKDKNYELFVNDLVCNKFGIAELFCKYFDELKSLNYINGYGLDVGCGVGPISIFLADNGYKIDAIEINGIACNLMKKNIDKYGFNNYINIIRSDFSTCSFLSKYNFIVTNPPLDIEILDYKINIHNVLNSEINPKDFEYLTNSWKDKNNNDLLTNIFIKSNEVLYDDSKIIVIFIDLYKNIYDYIINLSDKFFYKIVYTIKDKIMLKDVGIPGNDFADAYILIFEKMIKIK